MPKLKTRKSIAKRFKLLKSGKIKRSQAFGGHLMGGKTSKRKRQLRRNALVNAVDAKTIRRLLPYG